ncbi:MAG: 4Fe-4S dicluster domain-containing protein [Planctomycetaceae bacterium]|nr:4Fe-4S dicluster domain-containing protein [Planctomycetaceae bacterium]
MTATPEQLTIAAKSLWLDKKEFQSFLNVLREGGYQIIGPRIEQGAIVYGPVDRVEDFPLGWTDEQAPGLYRLKKRDDDALFGYAVGPHSWKRFLFPPQLDMMRSKKVGAGWDMEPVPVETVKYAFLGVRACELSAIEVQDRVFLNSTFPDEYYQQRRRDSLIIAVNCTMAAATCFCTSMDSGPRCRTGYDLALTELIDGYVVEVGSVQGATLIERLALPTVAAVQEERAEVARRQAVEQIQRVLDREHVQSTLKQRLNHVHWDDVAARCLSCANCTMVCPTCFCSSVEDVTMLVDQEVVRQRRWDSCFNFDFSHVSGGPVRDQTRSRYRQWLTHKLTTWVDQFGTSGCVGCGRCITWCPVGIDLTKESVILCSEAGLDKPQDSPL